MQSSCSSCLPPSALSDPQEQQHQHLQLLQRCSGQEGPAWHDPGSDTSPRGRAAGSCPAAQAGRAQQPAQPTAAQHTLRLHHQKQRKLSRWALVAALVVWAVLARPCQGLPLLEISLNPLTAKTASVSYTWAVAASVVPPQVTMAFSEAKSVSLAACLGGRGGGVMHA